ncbi:MAG: DUF3825 domain-containing protein, partial [Faecalibacterium sp.]|nr:DUF3825 domain-containing protein [Faecalibacterium sp.]
MKGRMRPYLPELTIRDYNIYLRYLRGVRRQLYEAYGLYSCHLLRSNGVLFAILSDSLAGRQATCQRKRVPGTMAWRRLMCQTQGIRLAAQVEVLLGWHNLQDRKYSELKPLKRLRRVVDRLLLRRAFEGAVVEAARRAAANYTLAVPQFYGGRIQLLLPLCLTGDKPELALTIQRE